MTLVNYNINKNNPDGIIDTLGGTSFMKIFQGNAIMIF